VMDNGTEPVQETLYRSPDNYSYSTLRTYEYITM